MEEIPLHELHENNWTDKQQNASCEISAGDESFVQYQEEEKKHFVVFKEHVEIIFTLSGNLIGGGGMFLDDVTNIVLTAWAIQESSCHWNLFVHFQFESFWVVTQHHECSQNETKANEKCQKPLCGNQKSRSISLRALLRKITFCHRQEQRLACFRGFPVTECVFVTQSHILSH